MQSSRPARIPYPDTSAPTKVAADSFNCLRLYPARSITARPRGHGDTGQTMGVDRHRLAGRGADGLADDLLQPAEQPCTRSRTSSLEIAASSAVRHHPLSVAQTCHARRGAKHFPEHRAGAARFAQNH
jgi:hypothetical protein